MPSLSKFSLKFSETRRRNEELEQRLSELTLRQQEADNRERQRVYEAERQRLALVAKQQRELEEHAREKQLWLKVEADRRSAQEEAIRANKAAEEAALKAAQKEYQREQRRIEQLRRTNPEALREVRDLIKERFSLDTEIWRLREVKKCDRRIVEAKMQRADEVLKVIMERVETWTQASFENQETWVLARHIKNKLAQANQKTWANSPPWLV